MKYFIVEGTFTNPLPVAKEAMGKIISEHQQFLQKGFDEGWMLFSGPKAKKDGGFAIVKAETQHEVDGFFANDPMLLAGVQEYRITEFLKHDCQDMLDKWFE